MLNKVIIMGRLTAAPELKTTTGGVQVTSFCVAVDRPARAGEQKQADFINVVAWRGTAELICRYFGKGSPIIVEGRLQTRSYTDRSGAKRTAVEVVADSVSFCLANSNGGDNSNSNTGRTEQPAAQIPQASGEEFSEMMCEESDLPF